jgi:hypothetical protein
MEVSMSDTEHEMMKQAEEYLTLSEEELYLKLVPTSGELFNREGRIARGRAIFEEVLTRHRDVVCSYYNKQPTSFRNAIDLILVITNGIANNPSFLGIAPLPFAAILVKTGLDKICAKPEQ